MAVEVFKLFGSIFVNNDEANKSIQKTDQKASGVASTMAKGAKTAAKWGSAIIGGTSAAAGGMMKMAQSSASAADTVDKMSQKIGVSRQAYQELDFICSQSGTSVDKLQGGMKSLRNAMDGDKNAEIFQNLGISLRDAEGNLRSSEDVMWDAMNALQGVADADEKAALAQKLFGKSGSDLMPLLNGQAGSIDEMKQKAHDLGLVMSDELIDSGVGLTDSLDQTKRAFSAVKTQLGGALMPIVKKFSDHLQSALPDIQSAISKLTPIVSSFLDNMLPSLFDLGEALLPKIFEAIEQLLPVFEQFATALLPVLLQFIELLTPIFVQITTDILPILVQIIQQLMPFILQIIEQLLPFLAQTLQTILPFAVQIAQTVLPVVLQIIEQLLPMFLQICQSVLPIIIGLLQQLLPPFVEIVQTLLPFFLQTFEAVMPILDLLAQTLLPLLSGLLGALTPVVSGLAEAFSDSLGKALETVSTYLEPLTTILDGLITFITGVFTGNWEEAWNGVVDIFKGIINLIPAALETMLNGAIGLLNGMIDGINTLGGWIGIDLDHIPEVELPRLRAGIDYVPNDKFPAYLDRGEAVLPANEAEAYRNAKRGGERKGEEKIINQTINITVTVDKIDRESDIDELAVLISERLADEVRRSEGVYA